MARIRRCPACGFANPATEMMCQQCATLIADIEPLEESAPEKMDAGPEETVRMSDSIAFCTPDGSPAFSCASGSIIGRQHCGGDFLADKKTVSRRHCRVELRAGDWVIEDLGSVNGTWLNGEKTSGPTVLANGDLLQLSLGCALKVKI